jgi:hypothetical protein
VADRRNGNLLFLGCARDPIDTETKNDHVPFALSGQLGFNRRQFGKAVQEPAQNVVSFDLVVDFFKVPKRDRALPMKIIPNPTNLQTRSRVSTQGLNLSPRQRVTVNFPLVNQVIDRHHVRLIPIDTAEVAHFAGIDDGPGLNLIQTFSHGESIS